VPFATRAVTYACPTSAAGAGDVQRYANYGFNAGQLTTGLGTAALVAQHTICEVDYTPNVLQRNGILYIKLTVADGTTSGETVSVFQQIHVDNAP
jgi:hypothetical protein